MALPPMTLEGIRPFLSENVNNALAENYADDDIPQCFSEEGVSIQYPSMLDRNICMRWKRNEENNVTGIFWRIFQSNNVLVGFNPIEEGYECIVIAENSTKLSRIPDLFGGILNTLNTKQIDRVEIPFNINQIKDIEAIREFFASNPELLPANFRERVFAQEENGEPINYKLLIGSLLAFAVISYIAIKILHKPPKAEVK